MSYYTPYNKTIKWPANKINQAPAVNNLHYLHQQQNGSVTVDPFTSHLHFQRPKGPAAAPDTKIKTKWNPRTYKQEATRIKPANQIAQEPSSSLLYNNIHHI